MIQLAMLAAKSTELQVRWSLEGVVALAAGILILFFPRVLNYVVAAYLIFIGLVKIFNLNLG